MEYILDGVKIGDGAKIGPDAKIGRGATIGTHATIGKGVTIGRYAKIGRGATIGKGVTIGYSTKIGAHATIGKGVTIGYSTKIGRRLTWCGLKIRAWMCLSNVDGSGRQVKVLVHTEGVSVEAGCFFGTLDEFCAKAESEEKHRYSVVVRAAAEALSADANEHGETGGWEVGDYHGF